MTTTTVYMSDSAGLKSEESGTVSFLTVGQYHHYNGSYGLLRPDLSSIPSPSKVVVNDAWVRVYLDQNLAPAGNAIELNIYRILKNWVGAYVTRDVYASGLSWETQGAKGVTDVETADLIAYPMEANETLGWKSFHIGAAAIQGMFNGTFTNNGFMLRDPYDADYTQKQFAPVGGANQPELIIDYNYKSSQNNIVWWD
jgi:hypothetical protein